MRHRTLLCADRQHTPAVGDTLSITPDTVTPGTGGALTFYYQFRMFQTTGTVTLQTTGGEQIVFDEGAPTASAISLTEGQGGLQVRLEWLAYRG